MDCFNNSRNIILVRENVEQMKQSMIIENKFNPQETKIELTIKNSTCIVCCFLSLTPKVIKLWNEFRKHLAKLNIELILLSTSDKPEKLEIPLIKVPFSMKNFDIKLYPNSCSNKISDEEKTELIEREIYWVNDSIDLIDLYRTGFYNCDNFYRALVEKIKPTIVFLWGNSLPQMIIFQNILEAKNIPNFVMERGYLTDTLMLEPSSSGKLEIPAGKDDSDFNMAFYTFVRDYYKTNQLTKYDVTHNNNIEELIISSKENGTKIISFFGQNDVASGLIPRSNNLSKTLSPFFESTLATFESIINSIKLFDNSLLIFKPHPDDNCDYSKYSSDKVIIEKNFNFHSLLNLSDVNIIGNSTLQYEALLYETPVVLTANSMMYGLRTAYEIKSEYDLTNQLNLALNKVDFEQKLIRSKKFISWLMSSFLFGYNNDIPTSKNLSHLAEFVSQNSLENDIKYCLTDQLFDFKSSVIQKNTKSQSKNVNVFDVFLSNESSLTRIIEEEENFIIKIDQLIEDKKYEEAKLIIKQNANEKCNNSFLSRIAKIEILNGNLLFAEIILSGLESGEKNSKYLNEILNSLHSLRENSRVLKRWNAKISAQLIIEAEENIKKNKLDIAENLLLEILNIETKNFEALNNLAVVYILKEDYEKAKSIILFLLKVDPENEVALGNLQNIQVLANSVPKLVEQNQIAVEITKEEINNKRDFEEINFEIVNNVTNIINEVQHYSQNNEKKQLVSDLPVDTIKSKNARKIKIGFLATDLFSACPFLRVTTALYELQRQNQIEFINLIDLEKLETITNFNLFQDLIIVDNFKKLDIVVVQREFAVTIPFKELKRIIGNSKVKIVYEIDDNLINLYPAHPFYELYNSKRDYYIDYLKNSDLITVTTNSLREDFYKYNSKIAILPNFIDTSIWGNNNEIKKVNKKIKILFSGSKTHLNDLMIIQEAIINIYSKYKEQVEFLFWGDITEKIEKQCKVIKVSKYFNKYSDYAEHLKSLDIDIGLIPLKKNKFNTSKSNIKWLDYSAAGIASILSDVEAYNSSVINEINGILVKNDTSSWVEAIEDLIINSRKRERIAENAREVVLSQHSIQKNSAKWYLYYKSLINTSMEDSVKISIIVPTFNSLDYTKKFIDSLYNNQLNLTDVELVIVDNNSLDSTKEYLKGLEKQKRNFRIILNNENLGFPKAVNQGIQAASGKYILIANNDIVVTEGWLERLIEVAESDSKTGIVGPISNEVSGVQKDKDANYESIDEMYRYANTVKEKNKNKVIQFPRVAFLCTLIKREVIDRIGGLDERFSPGNFEDDDFCLRAQLAGYKTIIAQDVFIHHYGSKSFKAEGEKKYIERLKTNQKVFVKKWGADPDEIWLKQKAFKHKRTLFISINNDEFLKYFEQAQNNIQDKEYDLALIKLELALEKFDVSEKASSTISKEDLFILAANISLILKDPEKAKSYFESTLKINPSSSEACFGLGQVFYQSELFEESKTMFEWAVKNNPHNQTAVEALKSVNHTLAFPENHNSLFETVENQIEAES